MISRGELGRVCVLVSMTLLTVTFIGCDKWRAEKYAGTYACSVEVNTIDLYEGYWDTVYFSTLEVTNQKKSVIIMNESIPVDSLKKGNVYRIGDYSDYSEFQLKKDSLYYRSHSGGQGGNGTSTYRCKKN